MLLIGYRLPGLNVFKAFEHGRQQLEQHDDFIEMVEIIRGEQCFRIDVGFSQLRRGKAVPGFAGHCRYGLKCCIQHGLPLLKLVSGP